jgi:proline racemase
MPNGGCNYKTIQPKKNLNRLEGNECDQNLKVSRHIEHAANRRLKLGLRHDKAEISKLFQSVQTLRSRGGAAEKPTVQFGSNDPSIKNENPPNKGPVRTRSIRTSSSSLASRLCAG